MVDIWKRELVSGDLVMDLSHYYKYTLHTKDLNRVYGIIVSSTHMMIKEENRFRLIKCADFDLYKIENPLLQEQEIYELLVSGFKEWKVQVAKKKEIEKNLVKEDYLKDYKIGDILYNENNINVYSKSYYIYYGYCEIINTITDSKSYGHLYIRYGESHLKRICEKGDEFQFSNPLLIGDFGRYLVYCKGENCNASYLKFLKKPSKSFNKVYGHINLIGDSVTVGKYKINRLGDSILEENKND